MVPSEREEEQGWKCVVRADVTFQITLPLLGVNQRLKIGAAARNEHGNFYGRVHR